MLLNKFVYLLSLVIAGPICLVITLMDYSNGKSFKHNWNDVFAFNRQENNE